MIKPVASVPSGASQEQLLGQGLYFSLCTLRVQMGFQAFMRSR